MKLNHINLTSTDVPGDRAMFETCFGLRCSTALGRGLAVMHDDDGMLLVLNDFSKKRGTFIDPADSDVLHIGFLQPDRAAVDTLHARLVADGWDAPARVDTTELGRSTSGPRTGVSSRWRPRR